VERASHVKVILLKNMAMTFPMPFANIPLSWHGLPLHPMWVKVAFVLPHLSMNNNVFVQWKNLPN